MHQGHSRQLENYSLRWNVLVGSEFAIPLSAFFSVCTFLSFVLNRKAAKAYAIFGRENRLNPRFFKTYWSYVCSVSHGHKLIQYEKNDKLNSTFIVILNWTFYDHPKIRNAFGSHTLSLQKRRWTKHFVTLPYRLIGTLMVLVTYPNAIVPLHCSSLYLPCQPLRSHSPFALHVLMWTEKKEE